MTKMVTAKSPDGKRKMRIPIVAENGPFSVARTVNLQPGRRELERFWRVYHTAIGAGFSPCFYRKTAAVKAMNMMAEIKGNWDRPFEQLSKDKRLKAQYAQVFARVKVECGEWIALT